VIKIVSVASEKVFKILNPSYPRYAKNTGFYMFYPRT